MDNNPGDPLPPDDDDESDEDEPPHSSDESSVISFEENEDDTRMKERLAYVRSVRDTLGPNSKEFSDFRQLAQDYEATRIPTLEFRPKARAMFKEHPELIMGLNTFLPEGFKIADPCPTESFIEGAKDFVNKVLSRYKHDNQRFKKFLDIVNDHRTLEKGFLEVYVEMREVLRGSPDLFREFYLYFLKEFESVNDSTAKDPEK